MGKGERNILPSPFPLSLSSFLFLFLVVENCERHFTLDDFFECDARRLMLLRININARARASLNLLTSFRRHDDQTILGFHLRRLFLFARWWNRFSHFCFPTSPSRSQV